MTYSSKKKTCSNTRFVFKEEGSGRREIQSLPFFVFTEYCDCGCLSLQIPIADFSCNPLCCLDFLVSLRLCIRKLLKNFAFLHSACQKGKNGTALGIFFCALVDELRHLNECKIVLFCRRDPRRFFVFCGRIFLYFIKRGV